MNRSRQLAIAIPVSILVLLLLLSPLLPSFANPQTQVFEQAWQTVNDNFYDPKFNGVDWKAMRDKYKPQAAQTKSQAQLASIINQMLSELRTSHTRFYTPDEPAYYQLLGIFQPRSSELRQQLQKYFPKGKIEYTDIGIFTKNINGKTFISAILDNSPAATAGLKVGDQLLSVSGKPYHPIQSFAKKAGQPVKVLIQRTPAANSQQEISVTPKLFDTTTMFLEAQKASTQVVERQGEKIGYIHIWSNAADLYQQQLEEELLSGRLTNADGLILDLREGWGGGSVTYLNLFTGEAPSVTSIPRNGRRYSFYSQWTKPVVMLVNEGSRSAKEIVAYGFQQYNVGLVVGAKTAGAVVAGRPFLMADGSILYVAVADVLVNGEERLEGKGVTPDINVPFTLEYAQGADPQKERSLSVVLAGKAPRRWRYGLGG